MRHTLPALYLMSSSLDQPVQLRLLGEFGIVVINGDRTPLISYCKPKLLLALLALAQDKTYARAELAEMLWPDNPGYARANLRHALFVLRQLLAPVPDALICTARTVALNLDVVRVDALALLGGPGYDALTLEERLACDRGDFLQFMVPPDNAAFNAWRMSWQSRLAQELSQIRQRHIAELIDKGHIDKALDTARQWVQRHPGEERAHRCLIRLLRDSGNREAALHAYRDCCAIMADYYGSEPSSETRILLNEHLADADVMVPQSSEDWEYRPLAILAVVLSPEEFSAEPEKAHHAHQSIRDRLLQMAQDRGRSVCVGADGSLAVMFGYPAPCERPAEAAARLAWDIRSFSTPEGVCLGMGIHADATPIHSASRSVSGMLISQRAIRLAYLSRHREILMTGAVCRRISNRFIVRDDERYECHVYVLDCQVEAVAVHRMFGRTPEFDRLIRRWNAISAGSAPVATMVRGELGVGKSLLIDVFAEYARRAGAAIGLLRCEEGHAQLAFQPLREYLLQRLARESGTPAVSFMEDSNLYAKSMRTWWDRLGLAQAACDALSHFLFPRMLAKTGSCASDHKSCGDLSDALKQILLLREKSRQPLLLIWEDLQWADDASLDLIAGLMQQRQADPTMIVLSAREEFRGIPQVDELAIAPLSPQTMAELVSHRVKGKRLPLSLRQRIVEKSEGIPLYAEEMVRQRGPKDDVGATPLLEDMVAVGLAYQSPQVRRMVRFSAVAGDMTAALASPAAIEFGLAGGQQTLPAVLPRIFFREIGRQAVYGRLDAAHRRQEHERVARCLIDLDTLDQQGDPDRIAWHLEAAHSPDASKWWRLAAWAAFDRSDFGAALQMAARAAETLRFIVGTGDRNREELQCFWANGSVSALLRGGGAPETVRACTRVTELCLRDDDPRSQFLQAWAAWSVALCTRPLPESRRLIARLKQLAARNSDLSLSAWVRYACACTALFMGRLTAAQRALHRCIQVFRQLPGQSVGHDRRSVNGACAGSALLGWVMTLQGNEDEGLRTVGQGLVLAEDIACVGSRALCLGVLGEIHRLREDAAGTLQAATMLAGIAREYDFGIWPKLAQSLAGWARAHQGACEGVEGMAIAVATAGSGMPVIKPLLEIHLAYAYLKRSDFPLALDALDRAGGVMDHVGSEFMRGEYYCLRGDILLRLKRRREALVCWRRSMTESRRTGCLLHLRRAEQRLTRNG